MRPLLSFFLLCAFLSLTACNGDDPNPIEQLPPATQSGMNTLGCLINGQAFTPKGGGLSGPDRGASYQFVYNNGDSFFNFQVFGTHFKEPFQGIYMNIMLGKFENLEEGGVYLLEELGLNKGEAGYDNGGLKAYRTDNKHTGTLTVTHYDYDKRIISGTFEFEVDVDGETLKVTDGRFDMEFTL